MLGLRMPILRLLCLVIPVSAGLTEALAKPGSSVLRTCRPVIVTLPKYEVTAAHVYEDSFMADFDTNSMQAAHRLQTAASSVGTVRYGATQRSLRERFAAKSSRLGKSHDYGQGVLEASGNRLCVWTHMASVWQTTGAAPLCAAAEYRLHHKTPPDVPTIPSLESVTDVEIDGHKLKGMAGTLSHQGCQGYVLGSPYSVAEIKRPSAL